MTANDYAGELWLSRWVFHRALAAIFLIAFVSAKNQFGPLLGERGLLPVPRFVAVVPFRRAPSLFHAHDSDRFFTVVAWCSIALAVVALLGLSEAGPFWLSLLVWLALSASYLSIVNVGQDFYAFGWESMLVEAGFFAAFLGPDAQEPSFLPVLLLRWMLFRVELGAGLIKLRHDRCWRELTCLYFHNETQPMPNPLSARAHRMPRSVLRLGVCFSHFVQLAVPFALFAPRPFSAIAAALVIAHQLMLVVSGNYAWLNWLTIVLGVVALDDSVLSLVVPLHTPPLHPAAPPYTWLVYGLTAVTAVLSVKPALNLLSKDQVMNYNYNPLHIVNAYGAFGSVTRERFEVVVEGTSRPDDEHDGEPAAWLEYEFKAKPGDPRRRPPQIAPYHLRLDWLMWFLPFSASVQDGRLFPRMRPEPWFVRFVGKLLEGDGAVLGLMHKNPFPQAPPARVRASFYRYEFASREEQQSTGEVWKRSRVGEFLPPVSRDDLRM